MDGERVAERFRMAAFGMDDWAGALGLVAQATDATIVHLAGLGPSRTLDCNLLSGATPDMIADYLAEGGPDPARNPRTRVAVNGTPLRCTVDDDLVEERWRRELPIYRNLFRRSDADHAALVRLAMPGWQASLSTMRRRSAGAWEARDRALLEAIAPALSATVAQAFRLGTLQDEATLATVEALGDVAILLDRESRIVSLSGGAEALLADGGVLRVRAGRVVARDAAGATALDRAIRAAVDPRQVLRGGARVVLRGAAVPPVAIDVTALPQRGSGPLSRARVMLSARARRPAGADLLAAAYDLTAAEAAVAVLLAQGLDPAAIAARRGSGIATVRSQIKALFEKTGTARQGELVARMRDIG